MDRERWEGEGRVKREGAEGRESRERGRKARLGYLSRAPESLVTPLAACSCCINVGINQ